MTAQINDAVKDRFNEAVGLLEVLPDGQKFTREIIDGRPSQYIGKYSEGCFRMYLSAGYNYPGDKNVVFWFYPLADKKDADGSKIEKKVDFETGVKIINAAIDCDDLIRLFQAYLSIDSADLDFYK